MSDVHFPEKYLKLLRQGDFMTEAEALDSEGLKQKIIESENAITLNERTMDADTALAELKENLKALTSGYREAKAFQTAKLKYCLYLLEGRGEPLEPSED